MNDDTTKIKRYKPGRVASAKTQRDGGTSEDHSPTKPSTQVTKALSVRSAASKQKNLGAASSSAGIYEEERIPFDQVLRKLVSTKPAHKVSSAPVKRSAKRLPKKG